MILEDYILVFGPLSRPHWTEMKFIKLFLIIIAAAPVVFILWMNLTPGYFRRSICGCGGEVKYLTDLEIRKDSSVCNNQVESCFIRSSRPYIDVFLLNLSSLDFNRGPRVSNPAENLPEPTNPPYSCPKTEWVNCMPILTPEAQKSCTNEYLDWAKNNCPNFKGAAY